MIGSLGVLDCFLILVGVFWWEQYHDTAIPGTDYSDISNLGKSFLVVCW